MKLVFPVFFFVLLHFFLMNVTANASIRVCNETNSLVAVALGYKKSKNWQTEGWWSIAGSSCKYLLKGSLKLRYYYIYAEDVNHAGQWRGDIVMCVRDKKFKIIDFKNCYVRGYSKAGFFEIDTGRQSSWMIRLTDSTKNQNRN